jgi:hypothetical protein
VFGRGKGGQPRGKNGQGAPVDPEVLEEEIATVLAIKATSKGEIYWGAPTRCPQCGVYGFVDEVDRVSGITRNRCLTRDCALEWNVTRRALREMKRRRDVGEPLRRDADGEGFLADLPPRPGAEIQLGEGLADLLAPVQVTAVPSGPALIPMSKVGEPGLAANPPEPMFPLAGSSGAGSGGSSSPSLPPGLSLSGPRMADAFEGARKQGPALPHLANPAGGGGGDVRITKSAVTASTTPPEAAAGPRPEVTLSGRPAAENDPALGGQPGPPPPAPGRRRDPLDRFRSSRRGKHQDDPDSRSA